MPGENSDYKKGDNAGPDFSCFGFAPGRPPQEVGAEALDRIQKAITTFGESQDVDMLRMQLRLSFQHLLKMLGPSSIEVMRLFNESIRQFRESEGFKEGKAMLDALLERHDVKADASGLRKLRNDSEAAKELEEILAKITEGDSILSAWMQRCRENARLKAAELLAKDAGVQKSENPSFADARSLHDIRWAPSGGVQEDAEARELDKLSGVK
ncbi:MAG: hypothetical protein ABII07_04600 [Patescibacteria group bacterium]|nr:hypothetical protein [Patescibacteria group bacterium]